MKTCKICGNPKSLYILNNRTVCMKCDDLVFDLEIECDEESNQNKNRTNEKTPTGPNLGKPNITTKKP